MKSLYGFNKKFTGVNTKPTANAVGFVFQKRCENIIS